MSRTSLSQYTVAVTTGPYAMHDLVASFLMHFSVLQHEDILLGRYPFSFDRGSTVPLYLQSRCSVYSLIMLYVIKYFNKGMSMSTYQDLVCIVYVYGQIKQGKYPIFISISKSKRPVSNSWPHYYYPALNLLDWHLAEKMPALLVGR